MVLSGGTIEDASKRELKEETNLDLDELKVIDVFSGENTYRKYLNGDELYVVSVLCKVTKFHGKIKPNDGESIEIKWFKIDELPDNLYSVTQRYIDKTKYYLKEF